MQASKPQYSAAMRSREYVLPKGAWCARSSIDSSEVDMQKRLTARPKRKAVGLALVAVLSTSVSSTPLFAQDGQEVQAIWKPQEISFFYQSLNTFYSCDSLESKLEDVLKHLGAQAIVRVRSPDCGRGPVYHPRAEIQIVSPVPATADAIAERKENQTERELVARVTGKTAELKEFEAPFAAQWKRVTIGKGRRSGGIDRGDCELLDQVRRRVLPKLAVRVVEENPLCVPNSPGLSRPTMVVEALTAMPKPDDASAKQAEAED